MTHLGHIDETGGGIEAVAEFLAARLDERELHAMAARSDAGESWPASLHLSFDDDADVDDHQIASTHAVSQFVADNDPKYVIADIKAKRWAVDEFKRLLDQDPEGRQYPVQMITLAQVIIMHAQAFRDHPDYSRWWDNPAF